MCCFVLGFFFFSNFVEGTVDPHSKTGPLQALETAPPPLLPRGPFKASYIQAKARRALFRNRRACNGPHRGCPGRPAGKRTCLLHLPSPPAWRCQDVRGFSSVPPFFCDRSGARQTSLRPSSPDTPLFALSGPMYLFRFSKDHPPSPHRAPHLSTHTHTNSQKKAIKKNQPFRELLFTLLTYGFII